MHAPLHRILAVSLLAALVAILYPGCASPPMAKFNPRTGEFLVMGSGSLMEDSDYEEQEPIMIAGADGSVEVRLRIKKHGKRQTTVPNNAIAGWGLVRSLEETTAQRVSDNGLKAAQAQEATRQTEIITNGTKYLPAEGEAISRAIDSGAGVTIP